MKNKILFSLFLLATMLGPLSITAQNFPTTEPTDAQMNYIIDTAIVNKTAAKSLYHVTHGGILKQMWKWMGVKLGRKADTATTATKVALAAQNVALTTNINYVEQNLTAETAARTAADASLQASVNTKLNISDTTGNYAKYYQASTPQVQSDWNATTGLGLILNKPSIWSQSGNSFFANSIYKVGIINGVSMASTNPYVFVPLNRFIIGLNTDSYNLSGADKSVLQMTSDKLSFDGRYGSKIIALAHQAGSFSVTDAGYFTNFGLLVNRGLTISYPNTSISNISLNAISSTGNDFRMNISMSENADFLTSSTTEYALSSKFQNGDLFLNRATQKAYIKNNNLIKSLAFSDEVHLKTATPVYATHAAASADTTLQIGSVYRLISGSSDLNGQSERTRFEKL